MEYLEYNEESANLTHLEAPFISEDLYQKIHETTIIVCHDIFLRCHHEGKQGFLLVKRLKEPAMDVLWPIGGRILRGEPTLISLTKKVKKESGLTLKNATYLGVARTFFKGEPFGHNHGTDTLNLVYIGDGEGDITLDNFHNSPVLVNKESYTAIRHELPEYVQYFLDEIDQKNLW